MGTTPEQGALLVVEDDRVARNVLAGGLERRGYAITAVEGGTQALELIEKQDFDLVLLDIVMPDINGLEVLKALRKARSMTELPVIMVASKGESEDIVGALSLGANDYVTKPIEFSVVLARIQTQLSLRQAEETLRESEAQQYLDLYEDAPIAYFSVGTDGRVRRANRRAAELLGYHPGEWESSLGGD